MTKIAATEFEGHTPGPWVAVEPDEATHLPCDIFGAGQTCVAQVWATDLPDGKANAALIAAADALRERLAVVENSEQVAVNAAWDHGETEALRSRVATLEDALAGLMGGNHAPLGAGSDPRLVAAWNIARAALAPLCPGCAMPAGEHAETCAVGVPK